MTRRSSGCRPLTTLDEHDDIDDVTVERVLAWNSPDIVTRREIIEAIRRGAARGLNDHDLALRVGLTHAAVLKIRIRANIPSTVAS